MAVGAFVKENASIGWHDFDGSEATSRTREDGFDDQRMLHGLTPNE